MAGGDICLVRLGGLGEVTCDRALGDLADNWTIGVGMTGLGVFCGVLGAASEKRPFLTCCVPEGSETVKSEVRSISSSGSFDEILLISLLGASLVF